MVALLNKNNYIKIKKTSDKVIELLIKEKHSSLRDIGIIYNILMGFPYCIDCEGHYIYKGEFYNSMEELPQEAIEQLLHIFKSKAFTTSSVPSSLCI